MNDLTTTSPFLTLPMVLQALRGSLGAWSWRGWLGAALMQVLHGRLGEICRRLERLAVRFQAGRLRAAGTRTGTAGRVARTAQTPAHGKVERVWPREFGWLVRAASHYAAGYGAQLRIILTHPDMVALLAACPQAARLLRPVCRMLAVETSLLRPLAVGEAVAPAQTDTAAVAPRVRKPRAPVDWGRIPLPRGVLSAARRDRARNG